MTPELDFPVGPRAEATPALVEAIERIYGLPSISDYADLGGSYQLNLRLDTAAGSFVARVYRPWMTAVRLLSVQAIKEYLHEAQLPISLPLATVAGHSVMLHGSRLVEVAPFVSHDAVADSWGRYEAAFELLGRLHTSLAHLDAAMLPPPRVQNYASPFTMLQSVVRAEQRMEQQHSPEANGALAASAAATELLQQIHRWWKTTGDMLPRQLTHGDYGSDNLLFANSTVVALLDFDFLAVRERIFDLAYTLYWMFERLEGNLAPADRSWGRIEGLLECYTAFAPPLSSTERRALPLEMARIPLYAVAEAAMLPDPVGHMLRAAPGVTCARWLLDHAAQVAV